MRFLDWKRGALVTSLGIGMAWFAGGTNWTRAQDPTTPPGESNANQPAETRSGRVEKLLRNRHDDVDGLQLEGDVQVHFPPHLGASISKIVAVGDKVEIQGNPVTRPRGEVVLEASQIVSRGETIKIERPRPFFGRPGPGTMDEPMNATGKIQEFATNRHGDVDGFVMADGTEVKLPPHQGRELQDLVTAGEEVKVEGRRHETPHGDIHLHADRITAVTSGKSLERDAPGPGRGRPLPPHERHRAERDHGPGAHRAPPPPHAPQLDEILRELREVRRLLEAQQQKS